MVILYLLTSEDSSLLSMPSMVDESWKGDFGEMKVDSGNT